jgi:hypothetical protein
VYDASSSSTFLYSSVVSSVFGELQKCEHVQQQAAATLSGVNAAGATSVTVISVAKPQNGSSSLQELDSADPASPQAVKATSGDEILRKWRGMLSELSPALMAVQNASTAQAQASGTTSSIKVEFSGEIWDKCSSSSSSACKQLEELTGRSKQLLGTALVLNPGEAAAGLQALALAVRVCIRWSIDGRM